MLEAGNSNKWYLPCYLPCCCRHSWRLATTFCTLLYRSPPCWSFLCTAFGPHVAQYCPPSDVVKPWFLLSASFPFFLIPCLLQSVEWVGCHYLSICDQSKPVFRVIVFPINSFLTSNSLRMLAFVIFSFQLTPNILLQIDPHFCCHDPVRFRFEEGPGFCAINECTPH